MRQRDCKKNQSDLQTNKFQIILNKKFKKRQTLQSLEQQAKRKLRNRWKLSRLNMLA